MTDLFQPNDSLDQTELDPTKNYLEELVGEGKKFSSAEALAKSKAEADQFIERLKLENSGIRQELNSRVKMEEFLDKLNTFQSKSPTNDQDGLGAKKDDGTKLTQEDIATLLDTKLSERETKQKAMQNVELVKQKLQETLGPNYATKLEQMTNTLGLSKEFLNSVASSSPAAFLKLVGVEEGKKAGDLFSSPPKSQFNTEGFKPTGDKRDWSFYEEIRKKDPRKYWTVSVQNEMHQQAVKLGEAFKQ